MDKGAFSVPTAIVAPVFNDWANLALLIENLAREPSLGTSSITFVAVDDGSAEFERPPEAPVGGCIRDIQIVRLNANLGHQRAIALGLAHVYRTMTPERVVVMDSDGEDRPEDISRLIAATDTGSITVALRRRRSEGIVFKLFYLIYRVTFWLLTGKSISFGNYCVIPSDHIPNVLFHPTLWNNFAATLLKSRVPIQFVPIDRGARYSGASKMNFTSLVVHGVSAIAVFTDVVISRVVLFLIACVAAIACAAIAVAIIKFTTSLLIPGYATYVFLFLLNLLFVTAFTGFMLMLVLLSSREQASSSPLRLLPDLVRDIEVIACKAAAETDA